MARTSIRTEVEGSWPGREHRQHGSRYSWCETKACQGSHATSRDNGRYCECLCESGAGSFEGTIRCKCPCASWLFHAAEYPQFSGVIRPAQCGFGDLSDVCCQSSENVVF